MTPGSPTEPIRVAVLVDSHIVPRWVGWTVTQIDALSAFDLVAVVPADGAGDSRRAAPARCRARHETYRLYEWTDRRAFGAARAMRDTDLSAIASGRSAVGDSGPLDVVVSFLPADRTFWKGPTPRDGIWALAPMDDGLPTTAPCRFWELREGCGSATAAVVRIDDGRVIAEDRARADPLSLTRTRNAAAWTSARLILRCLRSLAQGDHPFPGRSSHAERRALPAVAVTVRHAARTATRGLAAKARTASQREEWFIAVRRRTPNGGPPGALRALPNPSGRYLADPFPIEVNGRHFLFMEDFSTKTGRGAISVAEARTDDSWSPPRRVIERAHHLSYPFVFEHDGEIYMLPETGQAGRIELHRAVAFPYEWRLERILLEDITAVDATLHPADGVLWLFANVLEGEEDRGQLWLFSSPSLDGAWRPHPGNPIVTDPGRARPAGRLFKHGGQLIRPSQDCAYRYGTAVVMNRVDVLSPREYRETPVGRIDPDWLTGLEGTHTYTFDSRYECLDGIRRVGRLGTRHR